MRCAVPTIIVQADWPDSISDTTSLVERVVPNASRDEAYIRQLVERIVWALEDAESAPAGEVADAIQLAPVDGALLAGVTS